MATSYQAQIIKALGKIGVSNGTVNPDAKHNMGNLLGEAFLWDTVKKYAEGRSKIAWDGMAAAGLVDKTKLEPGDHTIAESPGFKATAKVSEKVKRFSAQALAEAMNKRFKVAVPSALQMIEQAKVPTTSTVTLRVVEKGA
jgi:hypothetical protein